MKKIVFIAILSLSKISFSQSYYVEPIINDFFCRNGIVIDSCSYDALYTVAYQWAETPYNYAGKSKKGIDCSGLVKKLYEKVYNMQLQGGSRDIYQQVIPIKNREDLIEGDLVFFKIYKNQISHVGLYLQDGNFIHASTRSGVIISNLNEDYYNKYYFSGGRFP
ncbi:MAG: C40 family peptidase [Flavobacteriales bacterium]|nr:C40 family peptidase [Flavobacteriales bacterium]